MSVISNLCKTPECYRDIIDDGDFCPECKADGKVSCKEALDAVICYAYPEVSRGPANKRWIETMKRAASALDWCVCQYCDGTGVNKEDGPQYFMKRKGDICTACLAVGKVPYEQ